MVNSFTPRPKDKSRHHEPDCCKEKDRLVGGLSVEVISVYVVSVLPAVNSEALLAL
ncbi:hypothetical protein D3C84_960510 [compost metagenome]